MRTVNFRDDVLHVVADKLGIDPEQSNFLTNEAVPIGKFIDQWVRRTYDARDWPEWAITDQFTPVNHVVPFDYTGPISGASLKKIGRVLKVFLVNPETTDAPVDTPFTILEDGIHCGYEHGTNVWIRYIAPAPRFTAVSWRADFTYRVDDTVYSYTTGECYKSKVNNNLNHDPSDVHQRSIQTEITQEAEAQSPGGSGQAQVLRIYFGNVNPGPNPPNVPNNLDLFGVEIKDAAGVTLAATSAAGNGVITIAAIMNTIRTTLLASLGVGWTITNSGVNNTMDIQNASDFSAYPGGTAAIYIATPSVTHFLKVVQQQSYIPSWSTASGQSQLTTVTFTPADIFSGATYQLDFRDSDGVVHTVTYQAIDTDGVPDVINGILSAMSALVVSDAFFGTVDASTDGSTITFGTQLPTSLDVTMERPAPGGQYWTLVPFPKALADQVIRGAYGDLLKEWGQTDKGAAEEQAVPAESGISAGVFAPTPNPPMTGQQSGLSRYKL